MADESTNSKETENTQDVDSTTDSDEADTKSAAASEDTGDVPVVIEGEAKEVENETASDADDPEDGTNEATTSEETSDEVIADEPEPLPAVTPPLAEERRTSAWPLVGGGLIAGGLGFLAANLGIMQADAPDTSAIEVRLDELAANIAQLEPADTTPLVDRLDALSADVEGLRVVPSSTGDLPVAVIERIEALEGDVSTGIEALTDRIAALEDRIADIQMDQGSGVAQAEEMTDEELAQFQSELEQLTEDAKAQVEEAKSRASEIEAAAAAAAAAAERKAALASLTAAVESGDSFEDELAAVEAAPEALASVAGEGIATMGALQRAFPDVARTALATATIVPQDASATERLAAFLKRQTNARSLAPREGDDVDAVLSRAEANLLDGDLEAALSELAALPEEANAAMSPWVSQAQTRLDALAALSELTADN